MSTYFNGANTNGDIIVYNIDRKFRIAGACRFDFSSAYPDIIYYIHGANVQLCRRPYIACAT